MNRHDSYTLVTAGTQYCGYARRFLQKNGIAFDELELDSPSLTSAFKDQYPQVIDVPAILNPDGTVYLAWKLQ